MRSFDLVIIGAGVAGLTAAIVAARHGLSVAVVERMGAGGQVMNVDKVDNFPGFPQGISGYELGPQLQEQAEAAGAEFLLDSVQAIEASGLDRLVKLGDETLRAAAIIVAAGSSKRDLDVPGAERLQGRGVSHCASCDGPLFRGMRVCVVGGGDSALDEALNLAQHASKVTIVHRGAALDAQRCLVDKLSAAENMEVLLETQIDEVLGAEVVSGVTLHHSASGERRTLETEGVFVYIGLAPNTEFLQGLVALDANGRIETDALMRSSLEGVFAAGDIRKDSVAHLASSAGDGATAAVAAFRYVSGLRG